MDELFEHSGQAFLAAVATTAIIAIATFILFQVDTPVMTLGKFVFETLDSLLP